ncbi:MAG TPA: VOC family protein [Rhodothermales bacterium]
MLSDRLHHYAVAVADLEASRLWYEEKLDFRVEKRFVLEDARVSIVKLISPGGVRVELLKSLRPDVPPRRAADLVDPGEKHLCFHVDDIEATVAELRRRGIRIAQEPKVIPESGEKNCWIADLEGNMIEYIEELDR